MMGASMGNGIVYIILVNYQNVELTVECIESIKKSTYKNFKIVVVDNGSQYDSVSKLKGIEDIVLIESKDNLGFSGGNNLGIDYAIKHNADFIMLLNNDTIVDEKLVSNLVTNTKNGVVTVPKIYYYGTDKKEIWYAGGELTSFKTNSRQIGLNEVDVGQYNVKRNVDFCCGCCFMISKDDIKKVGNLREEYFLYCEDNDYSLRLKKKNISVQYIPDAIVWHKVSASSGGENTNFIAYYVTRNRLECARKNELGYFAIIYILFESMGKFIKSFFKKNHAYRVVPSAIWDWMNGKLGKSERTF